MPNFFPVLLATLPAQATTTNAAGLHQRPLIELANPCDTSGARFGEATAVGDFDGDGIRDIAVGAWGAEVVHVFFGERSPHAFTRRETLRIFGASDCFAPTTSDRFGFHVAAGQLDGDPADELVVGAPYYSDVAVEQGSVVAFGLGLEFAEPLLLVADAPEGERVGIKVDVGDVNGDGLLDVVAGAPTRMVAGTRAGGAHVFLGPLSATSTSVVLENPQPVEDGNFGHDVVVSDGDGDGQPDLFVSAVGNTGNQIPKSGQIFWFNGPIDSPLATANVVEDPFPDPNDLPSPRFGMDIDARGGLLLVGANRKDWNGVMDAGLGLVYSGPNFSLATAHAHPDPRPADFLAFRAAVANVVGDATLDVIFAVLPNQVLADPNLNGLIVWDGTKLSGPGRFLPARLRSGSHFANGLSAADLFPGGYEELVVGDPTFDLPGMGTEDDTGRVLVYTF